ncbi:hypothetical protein QZJ98_11960 [Acinetobacter baumannii]|nr:hypothetical protein [Acinetobacter baumannii]HCA5292636.1 hypothetical protein [Acinetobacter baumannii]
MENFIRLLNPKTVNYEAIRVDNTRPLYTAQDVILAISYAKLTKMQTILFGMYALNAYEDSEILELIHPIFKLIHTGEQIIFEEKREKALLIALLELCKVPATYKPSERNRAVLAGVSRMQVQRYLNELADFYKEILENEISKAVRKIEAALKNH